MVRMAPGWPLRGRVVLDRRRGDSAAAVLLLGLDVVLDGLEIVLDGRGGEGVDCLRSRRGEIRRRRRQCRGLRIRGPGHRGGRGRGSCQRDRGCLRHRDLLRRGRLRQGLRGGPRRRGGLQRRPPRLSSRFRGCLLISSSSYLASDRRRARCRVAADSAFCRVCKTYCACWSRAASAAGRPLNDKDKATLWRVPSSNSSRPGSGLVLLFSV